MLKPLLIISLAILSCVVLHAQEISNIHFQQERKLIHIYYDLSGTGVYNIQLYYSTDGGANWGSPIKHVSGDVGKGQIAGNDKLITWEVLKERNDLQGDVKFKVKGIKRWESSSFTDFRDGKTYKWVKIGEQTWMAENLNCKIRTGSLCYDNKSSNCDKYGRLYTWETAMKVCPKGWHLPKDSEWTTLINYLGDDNNADGKLKESGTNHWREPNSSSTNSSGFTVLPGGYYLTRVIFGDLGYRGYFWTASVFEVSFPHICVFIDQSNYVDRVLSSTDYFFSVRCVKD